MLLKILHIKPICIRYNNQAKAENEEMEQLTGLLMYMSIIRLPSYGMYWSKEIKVECVADIMSLTGLSEIIYNFFVYTYQKSAGPEKCAAFEVVVRLVEEMPKKPKFPVIYG